MRNSLHFALAIGLTLHAAGSVQAQRGADARNVVLVGHNDLNGQGDGGEGLALHMRTIASPMGYTSCATQAVCPWIEAMRHEQNLGLILRDLRDLRGSIGKFVIVIV